MTTLAELWTSLFPAAVPVAAVDAPARAREVGWARVLKARVPAFDALEAGDLAIVPAGALAAVAPGSTEAAALVAEFIRARVAALLLVEGEPGGGAAAIEALAVAVASAGLPAFRSPRLDPSALERSVIGFLVNRRAELDRQATLLEARLETLALEGTDLTALVGAVGAWLGRAVALEGRRGDPLAVHAPPDVPGAAAAAQAYLARPRSVALRVALPAAPTTSTTGGPAARGPAVSGSPRGTPDRHRSGSLALLGDRPPSQLERIVVERIAPLLALELARDASVRRARDATARGDALPTDGPPWVVLLADQAPPGGEATLEAREELRRELRLLAPGRRLALRGDAASLELRVVLAASPDDAGALAAGERIGRFLDRTVAVSRPFSDPTDRPAAEAEARATLEAARPLVPRPAVARADRLPAYRLLGGLHNLPDGLREARALLEPLFGGREGARAERLATLRALLDHPGAGEAAAALGVHRNTLAYRVRRIEELGGWSLADPDLRLALAMAVRIVGHGPPERLPSDRLPPTRPGAG
jgi:PucR C-terminal helix-turn-helix domain